MSKLSCRWLLSFVFLTLSFLMPAYAADTSDAEGAGSNNTSLNQQSVNQQFGVKSLGTDLWRDVRRRDTNIIGISQESGLKSGILIDTKGNEWRKFRLEWLLPYGGYFLVGALAFLGLLFLLVRKSRIPGGRSGKKVRRLSSMQIISHWFMVALIGFMSLTGILLLFGRTLIIPLMGADAFSPIASASKESHNLMGPLVVVSLLLMLAYYLRYNWPAKGDLKWLFTLGGLLSKKHLEVGYFNAGEKILFWTTIVLGIILSVSGLLLLFPYYEPTIERTQLALLIHAIAALILIAMAFGHIWMVLTVEGTIDAMKDGKVDENWAKSHHSRWYATASKSETADTETTESEAGNSETNKEGAY